MLHPPLLNSVYEPLTSRVDFLTTTMTFPDMLRDSHRYTPSTLTSMQVGLLSSISLGNCSGLSAHLKFMLFEIVYTKNDVLLGTAPCGYLLNWVVKQMPWNEKWLIDHEKKTVTPNLDKSQGGYTHSLKKLIEETLLHAKAKESFKVLKGWRNELYPVTGLSSKISMERAGSALFGINSYGVHMTAYTKDEGVLKIWVPRRQAHKSTYGGMLDNTVAGGISFGETAIDSLVREAQEEASFSERLVRQHAKLCGTVSYFMVRDERAGGEPGLLQPECQFVYDLELGPDVVPIPNDDEVENFQLWSVEEVQKAIAEDQFKPNCAMVLLDFFVRHGILTPENEKDYVEIVSRLHRKLPFSTEG